MFITCKNLSEEIINQEKIHGLQKFYKNQRINLNILIESDGSPTGGEWSFDKLNRKTIRITRRALILSI